MATNSLLSKAFWLATIQRCLRVFAAAVFALVSADVTNVLEANWGDILATAAMAPVLTLLFCIAGDTITGGTGPAFGTSEVLSPPAPAYQGSALKGQAGYAVLGAIGIGLIILTVLLLVATLLKLVAVSWIVLIVLFVIGVVLLALDGGVHRRL